MIGQELAKLAMEILPLKWGYIYGQAGAMWTAAKQKELEQTTAEKFEAGRRYGAKWIGHNVADCSGLVLYLCKQLGFSVPHGSNSIWRECLSEKRIIGAKDIPAGALVFKLRNGTDYYHVGVYVGGGKVVEAKGTQAGVVESDLSTWTHYGLLKQLNYSGAEEKDESLKGGSAVVDVPNNGTVNVRESPAGKKVDVLKEGEKCEVMSVFTSGADVWAKVEYKRVGYIMAKYLRND